MYRKSLKYLHQWKTSSFRSPLILRGTRQVGKTWIVREFAKDFENFFELNLEESPEYINLFKNQKGHPSKIIETIIISSGKELIKGSVLFFIDEIQECPEAIVSLRYFKEKCPDVFIIAAGSLIEFALKEISFPVGRIDFFHIFPLDFEEYLLARSKHTLLKIISKLPSTVHGIEPIIHNKLLEEYKLYCALGGMPEVIKAFVKTKNLEEAQAIQQKLIVSYRNDFNKYATRSEIKYIKAIFDSIPLQLGQKFMFSRAAPETKSRDLNIGLNLLVDAGLAYKCYHSSGNQIPLASEINEHKFKVFFFDTGLVQRLLGRSLSTLVNEKNQTNEFALQGNICESIVAQELISLTKSNENPSLYYWLREAKSAQAEVDFLLQVDDKILPLEVKRGSRRSHKSLSLFLEEKKKILGLVISIDPFSDTKDLSIKNFPFYFIHQIKKYKNKLP